MAYMITSSCTGCSACEHECPNKAIRDTGDGFFAIDPAKCTECIGFFDEPQCVSACPIEGTCEINPDFPRYQPSA